MAKLKAGFQLYRLTADCQAVLLENYSQNDKTVILPANTIFSVKEDAATVAGVACYGISANGKLYRVEVAVLEEKSERL